MRDWLGKPTIPFRPIPFRPILVPSSAGFTAASTKNCRQTARISANFFALLRIESVQANSLGSFGWRCASRRGGHSFNIGEPAAYATLLSVQFLLPAISRESFKQ